MNSIHKHALDGMSHLLYLFLQNNRLSDIPCTAFNGLQRLLHLDLSSNRLTSLAGDLFSQQVALETLLLTDNRIARADFYLNAAHLHTVDLSRNPLVTVGTQITHHAGVSFTRRRLFRFDGVNSFVCNCSSLGFSVWWSRLHGNDSIDSTGMGWGVGLGEKLKCANRKGISVAQFGHQGLSHCEHSSGGHKTAVGLLTTVVVLAAAAGIIWTVVHLRRVRGNPTSGAGAGEGSVTSAARYRQFRNDDDISFR